MAVHEKVLRENANKEIIVEQNNMIPHLENQSGIDIYYFRNLLCFNLFNKYCKYDTLFSILVNSKDMEDIKSLFEFQGLLKIIPTTTKHTRIAQLLSCFYSNLIVEEDSAIIMIEDKEVKINSTLVYDTLRLRNKGLEILNSCNVEF
jgi:hypothetical protein